MRGKKDREKNEKKEEKEAVRQFNKEKRSWMD